MTSVLVVDDVPALAASFSRVLARSGGFEIVGCCYDGAEAIRVATRERPDLIVMDIRMPGLDGLQATRAIMESLPATKVVLLSAYDDPALIREGTAAGASAYLIKGTNPRSIVDSIHQVLR